MDSLPWFSSTTVLDWPYCPGCFQNIVRSHPSRYDHTVCILCMNHFLHPALNDLYCIQHKHSCFLCSTVGLHPGLDGWRMCMMIFAKWKWKDGEDWWKIEKNGGRLFRSPKLTLSCSAEGKEGRTVGLLFCTACNQSTISSFSHLSLVLIPDCYCHRQLCLRHSFLF
jgi:hypothetical protein